MFQVGDYVIYSTTGVCKIEGFTTPKECQALKGMEPTRKYYVLEPVFGQGVIYTPVEGTKVFMRAVISKDEANRLIDSMPTVDAKAFHAAKTQELKEHYDAVSNTHDCADLVELSMSLYAKKKSVTEANRKFGQVDERYMKQTEDTLFGELAVALGIKKDEVQEYIAQRLNTAGAES